MDPSLIGRWEQGSDAADPQDRPLLALPGPKSLVRFGAKELTFVGWQEPSRSSSGLILWETAEGVTLRCCAARSKLPVRMTAARAERW
jgi:hypothetical protein